MSTALMSVVPAVDRLHPVGLPDLVARAALLTRVDRKYVVPSDIADHVISQLSTDARALEKDGRRAFGYTSLYYDTEELTSYRSAARGRRRRFKVRRRTYLDGDGSFLELKTRGPRGANVKERMPLLPGEELPVRALAFVDDGLRRAGILEVHAADLRPVMRTSYTRSTLLLTASATRVTVDSDLAWQLVDGASLAMNDHVIVETKSGNAPSLADRQLWAAGCRPVRISKYGTGLAVLRDELPSNRWRRVMHRHFPRPATTSTSAHEDGARCAPPGG